MSETTRAELPEKHTKDLRDLLAFQIGERRRWPWPEGLGAAAKAIGAEVEAEAASAGEPKQLRERVGRLGEQLAAARVELARTEAGLDQAAGAVRRVMADGGDVDAAERRRDELGAQVQRLRTRVGDLEGAHADATQAAIHASRAALEAAARKRLGAARNVHAAAVTATDALVERFVAELAELLVAETEAHLTVKELSSRAGRVPAAQPEPVPA